MPLTQKHEPFSHDFPNCGDLPLVSCGLFVRNEVAYVRRCLESILAQSYRPIEICISDNASSDGTIEVLEEFAQKHDFIKLHLHQSNVGIFENVNTVIKMSRGDFFFFVGCDDFYAPDFVYELIQPLLVSETNIVSMSNTVLTDDDENQIKLIEYRKIFHGEYRTSLPSQILSIDPAVKAKKMNMFFLGIFRRDFLDDLLSTDGRVLSYGDRFLPFMASLCGQLAYIDKNLFFKTKRQSQSYERNFDLQSAEGYNRRKSYVIVFHWLDFLLKHRNIGFVKKFRGLLAIAPFIFYFVVFKPLSLIFGKFIPAKSKLKIKQWIKMP